MQKPAKILAVILVVISLFAQIVTVAQARFARGGQYDTFYEITACSDGFKLFIGYNAQINGTPLGNFGFVSDVASSFRLLGNQSFMLDGPPVTVQDAEFGTDISLAHTATVAYAWADALGAPLPPVAAGRRIRLHQVRLSNATLADYFDAIVQNCSVTNLPTNRETGVFYPAGSTSENPGSGVPDVQITANAVTTSTLLVGFGVDQVIADVNVGMYIADVGNNQIQVYLNSPVGSRLKLFGNVASGTFGTQEMDVQKDDGPDLVRDLMPNFVLDDDSAFGFGDATPPFITQAIHPDQLLSQLNGENPNGIWTLEIHNTGATPGTLDSWALNIKVGAPSRHFIYLPNLLR